MVSLFWQTYSTKHVQQKYTFRLQKQILLSFEDDVFYFKNGLQSRTSIKFWYCKFAYFAPQWCICDLLDVDIPFKKKVICQF